MARPQTELQRERPDPSTGLTRRARLAARQLLPVAARRAIVRLTRWPPVGLVFFGSLGRLTPISRVWGSDRGLPIDRYYIERFLSEHAADIRGRTLEIKDDLYTTRFGGSRVTKLDILHATEGNPSATIVADLTDGSNLLSDSFDCIVLTQTLDFIYDVRAALATLYRILKPGGVLLATVAGISKISREDMDRWGHYWSFTTKSAGRLFEEQFPAGHMQVESYGNVVAAIAFLHGLASEDLGPRRLTPRDPDYEVLISIRAVKPGVGRQ